MSTGETIQIVNWVERLKNGDDSAFDELLVHFEARLLSLTRKRLRNFPAVGRWEQTDDVFQAAAMRLRRALRNVTPRSTREFFGLAALQVRRELLSMNEVYRYHLAPSQVRQAGEENREGPGEVEAWADFHEAADALPEPVREVFRLLWYSGLSQAEAAVLIGVCERTIRDRWQQARLAIHRTLDGRLPAI